MKPSLKIGWIVLVVLNFQSAFAGFGIGKTSTRKWPGGVIAYRFEPDFPTEQQALVLKAFKAWQDATEGSIRFAPQTNQNDFALIQISSGSNVCLNSSPSIGRNGGKQDVFIANAPQCPAKIEVVTHEIGHLIGLIHEHQRDDRDQYIIVDLDARRVIPGKEAASAAQVTIIEEHDPNRRGGDPTRYGNYDLTLNDSGVVSSVSIMHYGSYLAAKDPNVRVMYTVSGADIPNFRKITAGDASAVQEIYGRKNVATPNQKGSGGAQKSAITSGCLAVHGNASASDLGSWLASWFILLFPIIRIGAARFTSG